MSKIYIICSKNFEYNDEYYYQAGIENTKFAFTDLEKAELSKEKLEKEGFIENYVNGYLCFEDLSFDRGSEFIKNLKENNIDVHDDEEIRSYLNKNKHLIDLAFESFEFDFYQITQAEIVNIFS